ncbi:hypothetical protein BJY24_004683 [Nocardia transvalensis]|uniref:Uncharacterized protein n=1 Tax=Nocardia transvalensis TaxID=37333 RepID=A0A7W9PGT6_9NOCA|nr:hypothetical protein [Nocardia transvalensis]MBB5915771.1 hypothetical protein [Nocardia transvalensis]
MRTLDSGHDSGVIGAPAAAAPPAAAPPAMPDPAVAPAAQPGPIQDVPLGQLPADVPPPEPPAFMPSRKEFEDGGSPLAGTPHAPGLGGGPAPDQSAIPPAALGDPGSPLLGAAHGAINNAQGALGGDPQGMLAGAHDAVNGAAGGLGGAASAVQQAAAPAVAAAAPGAPLPADPVAALMNGTALPGLPGVDVLFKPFQDLLSSFGTGVLGALNPATLLSQSSQVIQSAMQVGQGALKSVDQVWQGQAARNAQTAGQQAQTHGDDTAQRGFDISKLTEEAAGVVQRGNVQLTAVVNSLAAQATALAPVIFTPPAQATLIGIATEHLGQAVTIVNSTRGELAGYTGQLSGVVQQIMGTGGGPNPADVAQSVAQNVGQPIMEQAQQLISGGGSDTMASSLGDSATGLGGSAATHASSFGGNGAHAGSGGGGGAAGGLGGLSGGVGGLGSKPGGPGSSVPGAAARAANIAGVPFGPGMPGANGAGMGSGFMGAPGAAGANRGNEDEHGRTVQPYQSPTGNTDLTGALGETAPEVIGQTHNDEIINDYEMDQL